MNRDEIILLIKEIESSKNKSNKLKDKGISKATYYMWLKKFKLGGEEALITVSDLIWTEEDKIFIVDKFSTQNKLSIKDFQINFPNRTAKAIESKIGELGFSLREHNRKIVQSDSQKKCKKCEIIKSKNEFYKVNKDSLDGYHIYCKKCVLDFQVDYRNSNIESINTRNKEYRSKRKLADKDYSNKANQIWRATAKGAYATLSNRHKQKSRRGSANFNISYVDFEDWYVNANKQCSYCDIDIHQYKSIAGSLKGIAKITKVLTIDRIDSNTPYQKGNLTFACYVCNMSKGYVFEASEFRLISQKYIKPKLFAFISDVNLEHVNGD